MISRPSLQELIENTINSIEANTGEEISSKKNNLIRILARAFGAQIYDLYGEAIFQARQFFPFWATGEYLDRWGSLWGVTRQLETFARGTVTATGTDGTTIPIGLILSRVDGTEYTITAGGTISGGSVDLEISANSAGTIGNYSGNETLVFQNPLPNVDETVTITGEGLSNGFDRENDLSYRERIQLAIQTDSRNGRRGDWIAWALESEGVLKVWESPKATGNGVIGVHFTVDGTDRIPDSAKLAEVKALLEATAPVNFKEVVTYAPEETAIDFEISITPDTLTNRSIVEATLRQYLLDYDLTTSETVSTVYLKYLNDLLDNVSELTDFTINSPTSNTVLEFNHLPKLGVVTWV